jgi:hypothetical protein
MGAGLGALGGGGSIAPACAPSTPTFPAAAAAAAASACVMNVLRLALPRTVCRDGDDSGESARTAAARSPLAVGLPTALLPRLPRAPGTLTPSPPSHSRTSVEMYAASCAAVTRVLSSGRSVAAGMESENVRLGRAPLDHAAGSSAPASQPPSTSPSPYPSCSRGVRNLTEMALEGGGSNRWSPPVNHIHDTRPRVTLQLRVAQSRFAACYTRNERVQATTSAACGGGEGAGGAGRIHVTSGAERAAPIDTRTDAAVGRMTHLRRHRRQPRPCGGTGRTVGRGMLPPPPPSPRVPPPSPRGSVRRLRAVERVSLPPPPVCWLAPCTAIRSIEGVV